MCNHADEELKKLVTAVIAGLDLEELATGCRRRQLIMDSQIEALKNEINELGEQIAIFRRGIEGAL